MNRRTLFTYGAAISGALALTLFIGWWRVNGPGAPEPVAQRPLPLTQMDFQMTDQGGATVGPASLLGNPSMVFLASHTAPMFAQPHCRIFLAGLTTLEMMLRT